MQSADYDGVSDLTRLTSLAYQMSARPTMEQDILRFLSQLSTVQERALSVLRRKQEFLVKPDRDGLMEIVAEEHKVLDLLQQCLARREEILADARQKGYAVESISSLCQRIFPRSECLRLAEEAARQSQLIQFQSRANWMMTQKSIVHLSQMLEIVKTRGQGKSTYHRQSEKESSLSGGFVDRVA